MAYNYLQKGILTGSEYAAIVSEKPFILYGAEDKELFHSNFKTFHTVLKHQRAIEKYSQRIETTFAQLKDIIYSEELLEFDHIVHEYMNGTYDMSAFIVLLLEYLDESNIEVFDYVNLASFKELLLFQSHIAFYRSAGLWRSVVASLCDVYLLFVVFPEVLVFEFGTQSVRSAFRRRPVNGVNLTI